MALSLAASMMCMNLLEVGRQLEILNEAMDYYHADVMDGHYCPNITLSPDFIAACLTRTKRPVEVHLMVDNPVYWTEVFLNIPVDIISLHAETINVNAFRLIRMIRERGKQVGVVLNPATTLACIEYYADEIDLLTLMAVDTGYMGQKMVRQVLDKIERAKQLRDKAGYRYQIQVDGCCNIETYQAYRRAGADRLVMGSGLFGLDEDLRRAVEIMRKQQAEALLTI